MQMKHNTQADDNRLRSFGERKRAASGLLIEPKGRHRMKNMAKVVLTPDAQRGLNGLGRDIHYRIAGVLARLEQWPAVSGAKPLRRGLAGRFRIRTGDYRVQFHLDGQSVIVEKIGHRDGFYGD